MSGVDDARFDAAIKRLNAAESAKRDAIRELMEIGAIRSWGLVADLGETIAARYYGVDLAPPSTAGYDLVTRDGRRVQVRTLRMTPENARSTMGSMREPYDVLLAIRLNEDYSPWYAIEVPRSVFDELYPDGKRTSWTQRLETHSLTRRIDADELLDVSSEQALARQGLIRLKDGRLVSDALLRAAEDDAVVSATYPMDDGRTLSGRELVRESLRERNG